VIGVVSACRKPVVARDKLMNVPAQASTTGTGRLLRHLSPGHVLVSLMLRYTIHRLLIMIPTLLVISFITFTIIKLPPGDFLSTRSPS